MPTVQQSIAIRLPVSTVYNQLTQFRDYPQFMQDVEAVDQLDDTHLHWRGRMQERAVEWDATILEQVPDRCISWHNLGGPVAGGRIDVSPTDADSAEVSVTLELDAAQLPAADTAERFAQQLKEDLRRMKVFVEAHGETDGETEVETQGQATGGWRGEIHAAQITTRDREAQGSNTAETPAPTSSYAAGSEGWDGSESDFSAPVRSSPTSPTHLPEHLSKPLPKPQESQTASHTDSFVTAAGPVAEEVSFDQQSDATRRVGHAADLPTTAGPLHAGEGVAQPLPQQAGTQAGTRTDLEDGTQENQAGEQSSSAHDQGSLRDALQRAVPPSEGKRDA